MKKGLSVSFDLTPIIRSNEIMIFESGMPITNNFYPLQGWSNGTGSDPTDPANFLQQFAFVAPVAGTFDLLTVSCNAPGVGKTRSYTLIKNTAGTTLTISPTGTDTFKQDTTHQVSAAAGDLFCLQYTVTGGPVDDESTVSIRFTPTA